MRRLTLKQREFATSYLKTKNGTASALKVYDVKNKKNAHAMAVQNMKNPIVINFIQKALQKAKYNPVKTINHLQDTEEKGYQNRATVKDALHASEMLLKLSGMVVEKTQSTNLNVNVDGMDMVELLELKKKYDRLLEKS